MTHPAILVFDSGLGGLTVYREVAKARPDARFVYATDDAVFPYGRLAPDVLVARVMAVLEERIAAYQPELVVIACNTASTLVLPHLRARFTMPFVGTVPAIKPAAAASRSKRVSVLATPGTVARDYTHDLVRAYAGDCDVALVGSTKLASYAETIMAGGVVSDDAIAAEIAPCFRDDAEGRTDTIVLACTHYPLLLDRLEDLAPWPVSWIDPAPAIARRVLQLIGSNPVTATGAAEGTAIFTGGASITPALEATLAAYGLPRIVRAPVHAATDASLPRAMSISV